MGDLHLPRRSLWRLYADGFVVNLLNPKTALFFLAFLPQWISPAKGAEPFQLAFLGLLFAVILARYGISRHMEFIFSGMVVDGVELLLPAPAEELQLVDWEGREYLRVKRSGDVFRLEC